MSNEYINNKTFESIIQTFHFFKREKARRRLILCDLSETHRRRFTKYADETKKDPVAQETDYYNSTCSYYEDYQSQLAQAFHLLSENIANWAKFRGIDIDDAIQEGVLICFEKIDRFDPRKGKAFNYMSTCVLNHYRQLYRSACNYGELKRRYLVFLQDKFENMIIRNGKERPSMPIDQN